MARSNAIKMKLPPVDDLFSTEEQRQEAKLAKIYEIPISEIDDFPDHPYRVLDDEDMKTLMDSIKERGVITPVTIHKKEDGRYEMISGHRRKHACELLGLETIRCEIIDVTRDEAIIIMVDSNAQRSEIAPTDKGWAYKMKLEAMKRLPGRPLKDNLTPVVSDSDKLRTNEELGQEVGESREQIRRYIRLTELVPELQEYVDSGQMKMRPAVELSYVDEETQRNVVDRIIETEVFPSHDQAIRIRKLYEQGNADYDKVRDIMAEDKPNQKEQYKLSFDKKSSLFPRNLTNKGAMDYVIKALEHYQKYLQRQREQAR